MDQSARIPHEPVRIERLFGSARTLLPAHDNGWRTCPETIFVWVADGPYSCQMPGAPARPLRAGQGLLLPAGALHRIGHARPGVCAWFHARFAVAGGRDPLAHLASPTLLDATVASALGELVHEMFSLPCGSAPRSLAERLHVQGNALRLLGALLERFPAADPDGVWEAGRRIAPVLAHIRSHLARPLRRTQLARLSGLSHSRFHEVFRLATGTTPLGFVHAERIRLAIDLLVGERLTLADIARRVGYGDEFHLSRRFKAETGLSPRAYRARWPAMGDVP